MEGTLLDYVALALLGGIFVISALNYAEASQRLYRLKKRVKKRVADAKSKAKTEANE